MPQLQIYGQPDFPAALKWQAIAFMRVEWPFVFEGEGRLVKEPYPPEYDPVHFAVTEGDVLFSYASIIRIDLDHAGETYRVHGFGNMFTFPPYRRQGYGRQVVDAASRYILESDVDVGILFCGRSVEPFYAASGWEELTGVGIRVGSPENYTAPDWRRMMLFVSEKGKRGRAAFTDEPLRIPWGW